MEIDRIAGHAFRIRGGDYVYQRPTGAQFHAGPELARLLEVEGLLGRDVQTLSTGELRKVLIARALAGAPRVLVCDEICDGLDFDSRTHLLGAPASAGRLEPCAVRRSKAFARRGPASFDLQQPCQFPGPRELRPRGTLVKRNLRRRIRNA